ncbi:3-deoxy-D-manno-octulosonic acid transferase [Actibacterium sp. XHP0104]|uniref:3-deoxy-D-manno-octulosonic acid transferase n=1 Tax=Actibacterium sp. XHP0104 TaxID=2984335 RepID=UPI0021E81903|nr:glycosyltransferase N-terminal domain-containing protein [Actibacterium sp. XHP0104]MCV2881979.1 hypothetical protein [Actibacterium sp. XHP0104]
MAGMLNWLRTLVPGPAPQEPDTTDPQTPDIPLERPGGGPLMWVHIEAGRPAGPVRALMTALDDEYGTLNFLVTGPGSRDADFTNLPVLRTLAPGDSNTAARTFLDHWRPDIGLFFTAGIPATAEAQKRGIPLYLIADEDSLRIKPARLALRRFDHIFASGYEQAATILKLGATPERVEQVGLLCEGTVPPHCSEIERDDFVRLLAGRQCWLALDVTAREDHIVVAAHAVAARHVHRLLLILVPADPTRGPDLAQTLQAEGWRVALRSAGQEPHEETQIYVADTAGDQGLWLRLSPITFAGGTLSPDTEPPAQPQAIAALGSALLHGPKLGRHEAFYRRLDVGRACRTVGDANAMARALGILLAPEKAAELAHAAWDISTRGAQTTQHIASQLMDRLDTLEGI